MREIVLAVAFALLVMTGGVAAAWFITQPPTAAYGR